MKEKVNFLAENELEITEHVDINPLNEKVDLTPVLQTTPIKEENIKRTAPSYLHNAQRSITYKDMRHIRTRAMHRQNRSEIRKSK